MGDIHGRRYTLLINLPIMGISTALIGCIPTRNQLKSMGASPDTAPILLILLRVAQGLAVGGEFGGAANYIAEHAPANHRGYYTSFIQVTATFGLILSLTIISIFKNALGDDTFLEWGWRLPFLFSIVLVGISILIRLSLSESPMFEKLKVEGKVSKNPLFETFGNFYNFKYMLLALFGATMGQGAVWYTSQFYSLYYLQTVFKVPPSDASVIVSLALLLATPFIVVAGHLSDKYGRKPIIMSGMILALIHWFPIYIAMYNYRYSTLATAGVIRPMDFNKNLDYNPVMLSFLVWVQTMYL